MKIVYLSNFFNHHQKSLSDALFEATKHNYWFVETCKMPQSVKELGYTEYNVPYVLSYNANTQDLIDNLIFDADAVIFGEVPFKIIKKSIRNGKLFFRYSERRYKSILRYLKWPIYTYHSLSLNKGYLLCASAFAARDYRLSGMRGDRCYRWGYFPEVNVYKDIETLFTKKKSGLKHPKDVSILWVGRLIGLKHPEMAISLASSLKKIGLPFSLKIIGQGPLANKLRIMIDNNGLKEYVHMLGAMPQEKVRKCMEESDIFLFTSDQNEGWGAVLNESMNSGCAVVASHAIGSVPYLIKDGKNGLIFRSGNGKSLLDKVIWLVRHPDECRRIGENAYYTMKNLWNAQTACNNLVELIRSLKAGTDTPFVEGPCSKAPLMNHNWM